MPSRVLRFHSSDGVQAADLRAGVERIQAELGVTPAFPADVQAAAEQAAGAPRLPELDRTDLAFVTLDPAGSRDLDQALHLARDGEGHVVHYAIADVAAFVTAGDPVDVEAHRRGETLYGADSKIPLHPPVLSEGAASLLPDQVRPALLWTIALDATGETTSIRVERARVRSTAQLTYDGAQTDLDAGRASEQLVLLKEIGERRLAREARRGGVELPIPEQDVEVDADGQWRLRFRSQHPVEQWNAQISLLTGMAAATLMIQGRVGLLRTLPAPDPRDVARLRRTAKALGIDWPADLDYPAFISRLDPTRPAEAAMVVACTRLFRGAAYVGFDGVVPEHTEQSALAADYAHVTAPLRRLGDRYAGEICLSLCGGVPVPTWVTERLDGLPQTLRDSARLAGRYQGAILDLVEATVLRDRVGESFAAVVVERDDDRPLRGVVTLADPAIEAKVTGTTPVPLGTDVTVRLVTADPDTRTVAFALDG